MFSRIILVALMISVQIALITLVLVHFSNQAQYVYIFLHALSVILVIRAVGSSENPSFKITWIIFILLLPLTGGVFYLLFGNKRMPKKLQRLMSSKLEDTGAYMPPNTVSENIAVTNPQMARQCRYIYNMSGFPARDGTEAEYFTVGEDMFDRMVKSLRSAKRFIFLEFYIIRPGYMWETIFEILKDKVKSGVEVRLMYDDIGCLKTLPDGYDTLIKSAGIKLCIFNPLRPHVSAVMNYRDHRKIVVIDGDTAFCGGINIADEYINRVSRLGHWKDTGVLLKGRAVWNFTFMFLQQWQFATDETIDFGKYRHTNSAQPGKGFVQVFDDSPLDNVSVTLNVYHSILSRATKYVYITTPYLVIDYRMEEALCSAAGSGVDVRIITPHIYDKWFVHNLTRSHYKKLTAAGVKIYEYTPGFMHGKAVVSDDKVCLVGTCNMDYRSFYLNYECTVAFYNAPIIEDVREDMLYCQSVSRLITSDDVKNISLPIRIVRGILKLFAPLM